jgi:uncharacterized metal-binding protein
VKKEYEVLPHFDNTLASNYDNDEVRIVYFSYNVDVSIFHQDKRLKEIIILISLLVWSQYVIYPNQIPFLNLFLK